MGIFAALQNVLGQGGRHMDVYYTTNSTSKQYFGWKFRNGIAGLLSFCCAGSSLWCTGFSLQSLLLQSLGSRAHCSSCSWWAQKLQNAGSVAAAYGLCCPAACGLLPEQGLNPSPLRWQADSSLDFTGPPWNPAGLLFKVLFENVFFFLWTIPPITMSTFSTRSWLISIILYKKKPRILKEMADSRVGDKK